jgi:hypothetical protein
MRVLIFQIAKQLFLFMYSDNTDFDIFKSFLPGITLLISSVTKTFYNFNSNFI